MAVLEHDIPSIKKLSYEEFLNRDDEFNTAEWVDGEIIYMTVSTLHNSLSGFLVTILTMFVQQFEIGVLHYEPFQMKTGPNLPGRSPDLMIILNKNLSRLKKNHLDGPADLVIEVVSLESAARDLMDKYREYEQGGVQEYWILDPIRKVADFFVRGEDGYFHEVLPDASGKFNSVILEGLWVNVEWFWQSPLPNVLDMAKELGLV